MTLNLHGRPSWVPRLMAGFPAHRAAANRHEARVLAVLHVLGWPDDRAATAHPDVTDAGAYWALASDALAAADRAAGGAE